MISFAFLQIQYELYYIETEATTFLFRRREKPQVAVGDNTGMGNKKITAG